ncbi:hypothetical protein [Psychrobacillus sp. FSL K6-1415]
MTIAMKREFLEETGLEIEIIKSIGIADFMFHRTGKIGRMFTILQCFI